MSLDRKAFWKSFNFLLTENVQKMTIPKIWNAIKKKKQLSQYLELVLACFI